VQVLKKFLRKFSGRCKKVPHYRYVIGGEALFAYFVGAKCFDAENTVKTALAE
jgi:hypothetical protein